MLRIVEPAAGRDFRHRQGRLPQQVFRVIVVTILLNPVAYPAEDVLMLWVKRWDIELRFRNVKTTIGMEIFPGKKSGDGAQDPEDDGNRL